MFSSLTADKTSCDVTGLNMHITLCDRVIAFTKLETEKNGHGQTSAAAARVLEANQHTRCAVLSQAAGQGVSVPRANKLKRAERAVRTGQCIKWCGGG